MDVNFFDTYALIEVLKGNSQYEPYRDQPIVTTLLNLGELYYYLLKNGYSETLKIMKRFSKQLILLDESVVYSAMEFKYENRGKNLSMVDCIGYIAALKAKMPFLTGDKEFENLPGVEFVKK